MFNLNLKTMTNQEKHLIDNISKAIREHDEYMSLNKSTEFWLKRSKQLEEERLEIMEKIHYHNVWGKKKRENI